MVDTFYTETDWEQSSGPIISRMVPVSDLWPIGAGSETGGGDKDELENGLHPAVALGPSTNRPANLTGVVMTVNGTLAQLNMADKFISRQYVANILTYDGQGAAATYSATFAAFAPVYVDDSADLTPGVTLSLSPANDEDDPNPLFGYIMYCQDDYADSEFGGPNETAGLPVTASAIGLIEALLCVMQVNDYGVSEAPVRE